MTNAYDEKNRLSSFSNIIKGIVNKTSYMYGDVSKTAQKPGLIYGIKNGDTQTIGYAYDALCRLKTKTLYGTNTNTNFNVDYTYTTGAAANNTTTLLSSIQNGSDSNNRIYYTYDANENIKKISELRGGVTYTYNKLNELEREDNGYLNKTLVYNYDLGGNITSKVEYNYSDNVLGTPIKTISFGYDDFYWRDKLTSYNGTSITYDQVGNPLIYRDGMGFAWRNGRELAQAKTGNNTINFKYNESGIRTSKSILNGAKTTYYLNGPSIATEITGNNRMDYLYDESGNMYGMKYNGTMYYYIRNGQNDVIGLVDTNGVRMVNYSYDVWGKLISIQDSNGVDRTNDKGFIGYQNPIRYRGYYYDNETGLYYLNSRYYDPVTCRFINADAIMGVNGDMGTYNLYSYCGNNPVNRYDDNGMFWKELIRGVIHVANTMAISIGIDTAAVGAIALDMEEEKGSGVYHASFDCWQQYFGYNNIYDAVFDAGTSMKAETFTFTYKGNPYTIWLWKGDYINLGAGAELGIYRGVKGHRTVDTSLAMKMGMVLEYNGDRIIEYFPTEHQWWITGFNSNYQNRIASELTATFGIYFKSYGMYLEFKNAWVGKDSRWTFIDFLYLAMFTF